MVLSGGYCVGVPPLPIPNREVKPDCADGTAMQCGRVGSCLFCFGAPTAMSGRGFLCLYGFQVEVCIRQDGFLSLNNVSSI